jgi:SOS response associated peptidase (SRAP)
MCGRIIQASGPLRYQLLDGLDLPDSRLSNIPRRYNGAPSQELLVIRQNHATGERSLDLLKWGLVPSWSSDSKGGPKPINAMAETVRSKPMFRDAYRKRRCIVPVEGFFEWQATKAPSPATGDKCRRHRSRRTPKGTPKPVSVKYRTGLRHAEMEIGKWCSETGARNPPLEDRNAINRRSETGVRPPNPRECREFSQIGK